MSWQPRRPTDPHYPQPCGFRDPYNVGDEPSELGVPHSRDVQSTRVAGGYAAKAPSTNPDRRGGWVRRQAGELLRM